MFNSRDMGSFELDYMVDQFAGMGFDLWPNQNQNQNQGLHQMRVRSAANFHNLDHNPHFNGHNPPPLNAPRRLNADADMYAGGEFFNNNPYIESFQRNPQRPIDGGADAINYNPRRLNGGGGGNYNPRRLNGGGPRRLNSQRANLGWTSLQEIRGNMVTVAKDQYGCRFLQDKLDEGNPQDIEMIFLEIKDSIYDLMVHQFGNYLVQKFIEVCTQHHITQLLLLLIIDDATFAGICADMYGTKAVQTLVSHLATQEERCLMVSVVLRITVSLTKSLNGHHVLLHVIKSYSPEHKQQILNVVAENCVEISFDKSGCCVIQQCTEQAVGESRRHLIAQIISNALQLSQHPFGNYVVQYLIGLQNEHITAELVRQLSGDFVSLCMDKYGSNVVEKFLHVTPDHNLIIPIIEEILYSPNFLRVLQDPFGNYVAQSTLRVCKGPLFHVMIKMINQNSANLHSHPHGKRVLEKTTKAIRSTYMMNMM